MFSNIVDFVINWRCFKFRWASPSKLGIKFGCNDVSQKNCTTVRAKVLDIHPHFNPQILVNDIAIIKLQNPVSFNSIIRPICLPTNNQNEAKPGSISTAAGWGSNVGNVAWYLSKDPKDSLYNISENRPGTTRLMQVDLPIMDTNLCNSKTYYNGRLNPEIMICAGYPEGKKDTCQVI